MDFKDSIRQLSERVAKQRNMVATEEATKNAFIMPFISALGYDVFNPGEVVPEMDCDITKKKGEKIDYAIISGGEVVILIECKHCDQNLNLHDTQLRRYFASTNARFGILTNGLEYRFYTDLEKSNIMDEKPFFVFDILNYDDKAVEQLKKFHKSYFDVASILDTAQELKYTTQFRQSLAKEFSSPSAEFVRFFAKSIYDGQVTQRVIDMVTPLVKNAIADIINDAISDRLGLAMRGTDEPTPTQDTSDSVPSTPIDTTLPEGVVAVNEEHGIVTTQEEIEGFLIVKAIVCSVVDVSRVTYRDTQNYFSIRLDNNNRRPICILRLNAKSVKYIETFDANKKTTRHRIESLDDIYKYSDELRKTAVLYNM